MIREKYQSKENRDRRYKELVALYGRERVKRSSISNQLLHPEYVNDWDGPLERGFGNMQYKTHFPKLYMVEVVA